MCQETFKDLVRDELKLFLPLFIGASGNAKAGTSSEAPPSDLHLWILLCALIPFHSVSAACAHCLFGHMHRVTFPFRLDLGTDIVYLPRIHRLISKRDGRNLVPFAKRILHPLELRDLSRRHPQWQEQPERPSARSESVVQWLGGRFAAKEAARKALGATTLGWKDVRVEITENSGQPRIVCAMKSLNKETIEQEAKLSISHDGDYVVATVLAAAAQEMVMHSDIKRNEASRNTVMARKSACNSSSTRAYDWEQEEGRHEGC
jgi:holo-[acyl-carrier protein] synthase